MFRLIGSLLFLLAFQPISLSTQSSSTQFLDSSSMSSLDTLSLTKENVWKVLVALEVDSAHRVWQQIMTESAHLSSSNTKEINNLIGMKFPKNRKTTALGCSSKNYAIYKSWQDCLRDYKHWQSLHSVLASQSYHEYLRSRFYAEDSLYEQICLGVSLPEYVLH